MGLNKLRHGQGERDRLPRPLPAGDAGPASKPPVAEEGRQPPPLPGQVELFPAPAGSAEGQRLLF